MKKCKRIFAMLMMMVLAFSLCACGDTSKELIGTWETVLDYSSVMKSEMGSDYEDMDVAFDLKMVLEFHEDGTYSMYADEEYAKTTVDNFVEALIAYDTEATYADYEESGMSREEVDEAMQQQYGYTLEEYVREVYSSSFDADDLISDMRADGVFEAKGDKLFMDETEVSPNVYDVFSIEGDTLTVDIPEGAEVDPDEMIEGIDYPLTFTKVVE